MHVISKRLFSNLFSTSVKENENFFSFKSQQTKKVSKFNSIPKETFPEVSPHKKILFKRSQNPLFMPLQNS